MKGVIVLACKEMVVTNFGGDKWVAILHNVGLDREPMILPVSDVDDQLVLDVVGSACTILNLSLAQVADAFGDHWVNVYSQKMYKIYYDGTRTARDFLLKMDSVHVATTKAMANAKPPRFDYKWLDDKTLIMGYQSHRGLIDFLIGLVKGVGKYYHEDLQVTKLGNDKIKIVFP